MFLSLDRLFREPHWAAHLGQASIGFWLASIDIDSLRKAPAKAKIGFLNSTGDLLQHLGYRLHTFLPEIASILLTLLETAALDQVELTTWS